MVFFTWPVVALIMAAPLILFGGLGFVQGVKLAFFTNWTPLLIGLGIIMLFAVMRKKR